MRLTMSARRLAGQALAHIHPEHAAREMGLEQPAKLSGQRALALAADALDGDGDCGFGLGCQAVAKALDLVDAAGKVVGGDGACSRRRAVRFVGRQTAGLASAAGRAPGWPTRTCRA